jgi:hypothetical protein
MNTTSETIGPRTHSLGMRYDNISAVLIFSDILDKKFALRCKIAALMTGVCRDRKLAGDESAQEGIEFWQYVLAVLHEAGADVMSDEEDATVTEKIGNTPKGSLVKVVMCLPWRNTYFDALFQFIDNTTLEEQETFGRPRPTFKRIRSKRFSTWPPPGQLPKSFYNPQWLSQRLPFEREQLKISEEAFELQEFVQG